MQFAAGDFITGLMILIVWALIATTVIGLTKRSNPYNEFFDQKEDNYDV